MARILSKSVKTIECAASDGDLTADEQTIMRRAQGRILVFSLGGPLIFGVAKAISRQHAVLPDHDELVLDFTNAPMLGVSSSLALEKMVIESLSHGRPVYIVGAEGDVKKRLEKLGVIARLPAENVTSVRKEALEQAAAWLEDREDSQADSSSGKAAAAVSTGESGA